MIVPWKTDEESSRGLGRVSLLQLEHVATGLAHSSHLSDDGQVMDHEANLGLLIPGEGLSVAEQPKSGDVCGGVGVIFVHQPGGGPVKPGHTVHGPLVALPDVILADHQFDPVPPLGLVQPLMSVESDLGSQGLGQDQHIAHHGAVRDDELVGLADGGAHPADGAPGVHHGLSPGHSGPGLQGAVLEASHHEGDHYVPLLLCHLGGHGQQHQHVVGLSDSHGVKIGEDIGACDLALHVGILHQGVEEVCGLHQTEAGVSQRGDAGVHPDADPGDGSVHEVRALLLLTLVILETLQELEEHVLGNLAASTLEVSKSGQPEVGLEVMSCGVEGSPDGEGVRVLAKFELGGLGEGVLGALLGILLRGGRHLLLLGRGLLLQNLEIRELIMETYIGSIDVIETLFCMRCSQAQLA